VCPRALILPTAAINSPPCLLFSLSDSIPSPRYFFVEAGQGQGWSRYLKVLNEDIRLYIDHGGAPLDIWIRRETIPCKNLMTVAWRAEGPIHPHDAIRYPRDVLRQ
jgi:hypothetical protein